MHFDKVSMRRTSRAVGRVFMASFFSYFLKIFLDGLVGAAMVVMVPHMPDWIRRWLAVPLALELGTFVSVLISVYLLVRFAAIGWKLAVLGTGVLLETWTFATAWIFGVTFTYSDGPAIVTRTAGFILYVLAGYWIWKRAGVTNGI